MAFTVTDFSDLTRLLAIHPEWQSELRRLILTEDILTLPQIVKEIAEEVRALAEAQRRTDETVRGLAEDVRGLIEAQRRTDETMRGLAEDVRALIEAQHRTDERLENLEEGQRDLRRMFGEMRTALGATIEEEGEDALQRTLEAKGYRVTAEPHTLALDGGELDVVIEVEGPAGDKVWGVLEAKARLSRREVRTWAQRMKSRGWHERLAQKGVKGPYLVYIYGIRVDPEAVRVAQEEGIGLISGRGERVAPQGLVHPSLES